MKQDKAIIQREGEEAVEITFSDVKGLICPKASDKEVAVFLRTCSSLGLNPFAKEIYLVKFKEGEPASIIISADAYLKVADTHPQYDGEEDGVILSPERKGDRPEFREGTFLLDDEANRLVGGWAKVYRKDRGRPTYVDVSRREVDKGQAMWKSSPAWMLNKTALSRALRRAFPNLYGGVISTVEAEGTEASESGAKEQQPPDEFTKSDGTPNWERFWAKLRNNHNIDRDEAHALLGVDSIKDEVERKGRPLGDIYQEIANRRARTSYTTEEGQGKMF